jgi:hypothetical protein
MTDSQDSQDFESVARCERAIVASIESHTPNHTHRTIRIVTEGESNMNATTRFLATAFATLAVSGAAYAENALPQATATAASPNARTIYEGVDAQGQIVRVTISKSTGAQSVVVSSHTQQYPELNWTAHISSGTAATIAH